MQKPLLLCHECQSISSSLQLLIVRGAYGKIHSSTFIIGTHSFIAIHKRISIHGSGLLTQRRKFMLWVLILVVLVYCSPKVVIIVGLRIVPMVNRVVPSLHSGSLLPHLLFTHWNLSFSDPFHLRINQLLLVISHLHLPATRGRIRIILIISLRNFWVVLILLESAFACGCQLGTFIIRSYSFFVFIVYQPWVYRGSVRRLKLGLDWCQLSEIGVRDRDDWIMVRIVQVLTRKLLFLL